MTPPMIAISGFSGSGKTTIIEALIPRLAGRGLAVGILKHDAHGLTLDREGKDTFRFREAGARRVEAFDGRLWFQVTPTPPEARLDSLPRAVRDDVDLIIVEGGKSSGLRKIWIEGAAAQAPPSGIEGVIARVGRGPGGVEQVEQIVLAWLSRSWARRPRGVLLLAGQGARGASPAAERWSDGVVLPAPDIPPGLSGPLAAVVCAQRWDPSRVWVALAPGGEGIGESDLDDLWSRRRPGVWVLSPPGGQAGPAVYEPQAAALLEASATRGEGLPRSRVVARPQGSTR